MIEVYSCFRGINKGDKKRVCKINSLHRTRSNGFKLDKCRFRAEVGRNWFGPMKQASKQSSKCQSLDSFKNRLEKQVR